VQPVSLEQQDRKDQLAQPAQMAPQEQQAQVERWVILAALDQLEQQVLLVSQALWDPLVQLAPLE
jgi:hypothetical protein